MARGEKATLPDWFDEKKHRHTSGGIFERQTGLFLASDGLPLSGPARARRLAEAGKTKDPLGLVSEGAVEVKRRDAAAEEKARKDLERIEVERKAAATKAAANKETVQ